MMTLQMDKTTASSSWERAKSIYDEVLSLLHLHFSIWFVLVFGVI